MGFPIGVPITKVGGRGAERIVPLQSEGISIEKCFTSSCVGVGKDKVISFMHTKDASRKVQKKLRKREQVMKVARELEEEETVMGVLQEQGEGESLEQVISLIEQGNSEIEIGEELYGLLPCLAHG